MKDIAGQKFGRLTAISPRGRSVRGEVMWYCECDCGGTSIVRGSQLRHGRVRCCGGKGTGCLRVASRDDLLGKVFGRLTVLRFAGYVHGTFQRYQQWECRCECGVVVVVRRHGLLIDQTKSCGCLMREVTRKRNTKHGRYYTPEYRLISGAKARAKKVGVPFNLDISDVVIPKTCPLLGVELQHGERAIQSSSPTLDRLVPELGYVKGNVWVISQQANRMKSDHTVETMRRFATVIEERMAAQVSVASEGTLASVAMVTCRKPVSE